MSDESLRAEIDRLRSENETLSADAAAMRAALIVSWPESGDADSPVEACATCLVCDASAYEEEDAAANIPHAETCVVPRDVGRTLLAERDRLREEVKKAREFIPYVAALEADHEAVKGWNFRHMCQCHLTEGGENCLACTCRKAHAAVEALRVKGGE
jgi:hypothetical protein